MSRGVIVSEETARKAQGFGLVVPDDAETNTYKMKIGPKGEKVEKEVTDYYWNEVGRIARIDYKTDEDPIWGFTSSISLAVKIDPDPVYQNTNPNRMAYNGFNSMKLQEHAMSLSEQELEELKDQQGNPMQWAVMRVKEGNAVIRLMAGLLKSTGHDNLLIGKKAFGGFTDAVVDLLEGEELINELVTVRLVQNTNNLSGSLQESIQSIRPFNG